VHFLDRYTADGCEQAAAVFQQALELDHKFVPAEIGVARAYDFMGQNAWIPPKIAFERAREAANRALAIDPGSAAAHIRLANVHMIYDWNWAAADSEVAAAFKLGARDPEAFVVAAAVASVHGDWQKAIGLDRQALAQDPLNAQAYMGLGWYSYARMGRYAEAETAIKRALQIDPGEGSGHFFLAIITLMQGRTMMLLRLRVKKPWTTVNLKRLQPFTTL